jgi:ubiquinone/menaquinone biosynthesis C-methylase UbiE
MASQGDWLTRALSLSAVGLLVRSERPWRTFVGLLARRVPGLQARVSTAGYKGKYVRDLVGNALVDRSWPVRFASALALGECRSPTQITSLTRSLAAPFRAERIAAAGALVSCGLDPDGIASSLLSSALPAPRTIGDTTNTVAFLATMASRHPDVLAGWRQIAGQDEPAGTTALDWAIFLAGPVPENQQLGLAAEMERYDSDEDTEYLLTKPFSRISRAQNARLLHAFLVLAEHLQLPPGGRVLDMGSGSGWVSELLATFGFRVFTLDLSLALLNLGKRRFARSGLTPRFVVGDMTTLPVATDSVDAIIIMDALHHVPAVKPVFQEAFRVLADGGQFVIAEPGEGHAESERSRSEVLEYGVEEREIHLFEMEAYARSVGFDQIRVVPHYVPNVSMSPEQLRHAIRSPAEAWMVYQGNRQGYLSSHIIQSIFSRPVLVFGKGRRPIDSRTPDVLQAQITPHLRRHNSQVTGTVTVRNTGNTIWLGGSDQDGHVQLGFRLLDAARRPRVLEFHRVRLPKNVGVGEAIELMVEVALPTSMEPYVLKLDLVNEGVCWFEDVGSAPVYASL